METTNNNLQQFLILQLIIIMFCALYYEIKNIPEGIRDCTFEIKEEVLK